MEGVITGDWGFNMESKVYDVTFENNAHRIKWREKQSHRSKDPEPIREPRWRINDRLVPVSEKNGAHSVLGKNVVYLLWSCRRNWQLVVNSILLFHCVNARCFIDKSVIPFAP